MTPRKVKELFGEAVSSVFKDEENTPTIQEYISPLQEHYDSGLVRYGVEFLLDLPRGVSSRYGVKAQAVVFTVECRSSSDNSERADYLVDMLDKNLIKKMSDEFSVIGPGALTSALPAENQTQHIIVFSVRGFYDRGK